MSTRVTSSTARNRASPRWLNTTVDITNLEKIWRSELWFECLSWCAHFNCFFSLISFIFPSSPFLLVSMFSSYPIFPPPFTHSISVLFIVFHPFSLFFSFFLHLRDIVVLERVPENPPETLRVRDKKWEFEARVWRIPLVTLREMNPENRCGQKPRVNLILKQTLSCSTPRGVGAQPRVRGHSRRKHIVNGSMAVARPRWR